MHKFIAVLVVSSGLVAGLALAQDAGEKRVRMQDLPAAVQQAIKAQSQGATIRGLATEIDGGKKVYEAQVTVNGHAKDITFDERGTIVSTEEPRRWRKSPRGPAPPSERLRLTGRC